MARDVSALPEVRHVGWSSSLPYGTSELGRWAFEIVGDPEVEIREQTDGGVHDGRSRILRDARSAYRERARFNRARHASQRTRVPRQRGVGAPALQGTRPNRRAPFAEAAVRGQAQVREIVGVARQTSGEPDAPEELLQVYVPLAQFPTGDVYMVVQPSAGAAEALTPLVRRVVARHRSRRAGAARPDARTLSIQSTAGYRFRAKMVGTFAVLALVLAMVGVFGVLAYTVQQRQREIGVRMALGATSARVMWLVFRDAGWMIVTGAIGGITLAGSRPTGQDVPLWRRSARPTDVRQRPRRDPAHGYRGGRRARLAGQPHQPRRRVSPRRVNGRRSKQPSA